MTFTLTSNDITDGGTLPDAQVQARGNSSPRGAVEGRPDFGSPGYGGAAPPPGHGPHRYIFTVFAVDVPQLDVTPENSGAVFGFNLHFHTLAKASLTATYENHG